MSLKEIRLKSLSDKLQEKELNVVEKVVEKVKKAVKPKK